MTSESLVATSESVAVTSDLLVMTCVYVEGTRKSLVETCDCLVVMR